MHKFVGLGLRPRCVAVAAGQPRLLGPTFGSLAACKRRALSQAAVLFSQPAYSSQNPSVAPQPAHGSTQPASPAPHDTGAPAAIGQGAAASQPDMSSLRAVLKSVLTLGKQARAEKAKLAGDDDAPAKLTQVHLKRLMQLIKPEARPLAVSVATLGATTAISLLFPYAIGQILDVALHPNAVWSPASISIGLLGLFCVQSAMIVLRSSLLSISGERMSAALRRDLFRSMLAQETAFFDKARTGDLINRLSADIVVLQKALTANVATGLRSAAMVAGGAVMLTVLSPKLALLSLALIPPVVIGGVSYGRYVAGQQKAVQASLGRTMEVAEEVLANLRTVRLFAGENRAAAGFAAAVNHSYALARRIGIVAGGFDGLVHMAANISLVAVLGYGGQLVASGAMSAGDLTAFLMYSLYSALNISALSTVYSDLKRAAGAASRIFDIMDRQPAMPLSADGGYWVAGAERCGGAIVASSTVPPPPPSPVPLSPDEAPVVPGDASSMLRRLHTPLHGAALSAVSGHASTLRPWPIKGAVSFKNVSFAYPTRTDAPILKGFDLDVPAGASVALVGGSGSGKSTVAALLGRLYDPQEGSVTLDGHDLRSIDPAWLRSHVAFVSQEPALFADSIAENIRYGRPSASDAEVMEAARLAHVHDRIMSFPAGYETPVGEKGAQLSGGERARVAVARAVLRNAPIIVHDESTAALDSESEAALMAALRTVSEGRTTITIAHRLSTLRYSASVAVLAGGRVVETGPFAELFANDASAFKDLIRRQASVHGAVV